jgi:serine/threonine protein kinase
VNQQVEIDYRALPVEKGDTFILVTDGIYEHVSARFIADTINGNAHDFDSAARTIGEEALRQGSRDNLTVQVVRIDELPVSEASDIIGQEAGLPCPPLWEARAVVDGYQVVREIHASSRSHIYLAIDSANGARVAIKTPSLDLRDDPAYLQRFRMEEWVARRVNNAHVLKPLVPSRKRSYLYVVAEYIEGQTLTQWMIDNPSPNLETVRDIVEQIADGLQAFHRMEMLHQDLRPDNIMIDTIGTAKIIDFGSTRIAGVADDTDLVIGNEILGTVQYTAPEYFLGDGGSTRSDIFSLGVIAYQMLTGRLPYGAQASRARTKSQQRKLKYKSALDDNRAIPAWIDGALRKAVHPDPYQRYAELSEFIFDLRHPNKDFLQSSPTPLMQRNPLLFWQCLTGILLTIVLILLFSQHVNH